MSNALQLSGATAQVNNFVRALTPKQKALMAGAAALVIAILAAFVFLINKPDFKPLMTGLSPADAQSLNSRLAAKGIHAQVTPDGTGVEVASDQIDKARLETAADGMPSGGRMGFEIFDKPNFMGSDFAEKVNYQRALEGELEKTISSMEEVESARVHLVLEHESLFTDRERQAKASVVLKLRRQLPPGAANAIAQLIANAVDGLSPENVTLLDSSGRSALLPRSKEPFGSTEQTDLENQLAQKLVSTLEPVLGADHVKANVRVEYDLATSDETSETYDPKSAVAISMQTSREHTAGMANTGVPGTASNVPSTTTAVPKPAVTATDNGSSSETQNATYAVNRVVKHINQPAGSIKHVSAALLIDDGGKPRSPEELKKIEDIARAAIGIDANRGDTLVAQSISFRPVQAEAPAKLTVTQKVTRVVNDWTAALRIAGMLALFAVVYFLVLRPVKKQVVTTMKELHSKAETQKKVEGTDAAQLTEGDGQPDLRTELAQRVKSSPETATRLLQSWIRQPEARG